MKNFEIQGILVKRFFYLCAFLLLGFALYRYFFGNEIIGSWFEKPYEYTTEYWVYLQPDKNSSKTYRLKGDIEKLHLGDEEGTGYFLTVVYWNNGNESYFYDCRLTTNKGDYCEDDNSKGFIIRLGEKFY